MCSCSQLFEGVGSYPLEDVQKTPMYILYVYLHRRHLE